MKHKVLLVATGILVTGAAATGGLVFGLKAYRNKIEAEQEKINNEAKKINADYDNKDQTLAMDADPIKIKFSGIDFNIYEISIKGISVSETDKTKLLVTFVLTNKKDKTFSKEVVVVVSGFKKPADTKEMLNEKLNAITSVRYNEDKTKIMAKDAKEEHVVFENIEEGYEVMIKNLSVKLAEQSTLLVTFTIKETNQTLESDEKSLEIPGFAQPNTPIVPKTKTELNDIAKTIDTISYDGDKSKTQVTDLDKNKIVINGIPDGFNKKIISITSKDGEPTTAIVKFTVTENGGSVESDERTLEIPGFHKPFLDKTELDKEVEKVTGATFDNGNTSNTEVNDIDTTKIKFTGLPDGFDTKIISIKPKDGDPTTAIITFTVSEKDGSGSSKTVTIEIPGFKVPTDYKIKLNAELAKINNATYTGNQSSTEVKDIDKLKINFVELNQKYQAEITEVKVDPKDTTNAIIKFKIKEKNGTIFSDEKTISLNGFKKQSLTKDELDKVFETIKTVQYEGTQNVTEVRNISKFLIKFDGLDTKQYSSTIVSFEEKPGINTTAVIKATIKELNGSVNSGIRTFELAGFKKPPKTKQQLNTELSKITSVSYQGSTTNLEVSQIERSKLVFKNVDDSLSVDVVSIRPKSATETTTAMITIKVIEKNGIIYSDEKTLELTGLKAASKSSIELSNAIFNITGVSYTGDKTNTEVLKIDKSKLVFQGLGAEYTPDVYEITEQVGDKSVAVIKLRITEKNGTVPSISRTFQISGFKIPSLTKAQLDAEIEKLNNAIYLGNKQSVEVKNIEKDKIEISNLSPKMTATINEVKEDANDNTVAKVSFTISEKTGTISSKTKEIKVHGFKKPVLSQEQLNSILALLTGAKYLGDKTTTTVSEIQRSLIQIVGLDAVNLQLIISSVTQKAGQITTAVVKFRIRETNGSILSNEKSFEISGFKIPDKTVVELNAEIDNIDEATYSGDKSNTEINGIDKSKIVFTGLNAQFKATITKIDEKPSSRSTARITFKIGENGKNIFSKEKTVEITGFKTTPYTKEQLDAILRNYNQNNIFFNGNKNATAVSDIEKDRVIFNGISNDIEDNIVGISQHPTVSTTALIKVKINEKGKNIFSDVVTFEVPGFKIPNKTLNELNNVIDTINSAQYTGDKSQVLVKNIEKSKIAFDGLGIEYKATISDISADASDSSVAIIKFTISEKTESLQSKEKTIRVSGFKKPDKTSQELDAVLNAINTVSYSGNRSIVEVKRIEFNKISFPTLPSQYQATVISVFEKPTDSSVAVIGFKINEIGKSTFSSERTIELSGFKKPFLTRDQLDNLINSINTVSYSGDKSNTEVSDIEPGKLSFTVQVSLANIQVNIVSITANNRDNTIADIVFTISEKENKVVSKQKTLQISGFKKPTLSTRELNVILSRITSATYTGNKDQTKVSEIDKNKIVFDNLPTGIQASISSVSTYQSNPRVAVIKFRIHETGKTTFSNEKTIYINGFKIPFLSLDELNKIVNSTTVSYHGNPASVEVRRIKNSELRFTLPGSYANIQVVVDSINTLQNDSTTAEIKFRVQEVGQTLSSQQKTLQLKGFKKVGKTTSELNNILRTLSKVVYDGDKSTTSVARADLTKFRLPELSPEYQLNVVSFTQKRDDSTTGILSFYIKERGFDVESSSTTLEVSGFRRSSLSKSELDLIARSIRSLNYDVNNRNSKANTRVGDVDSKLISADRLQSGIVFEVRSVQSISRSSILVSFVVRETDGTIRSDSRELQISGFKSGPLTSRELNQLLNGVTQVTYDGDKSRTEIRNIQRNRLKFNGLSRDFYVNINSISAKQGDESTARIVFRISEINGREFSEYKILELSGFKSRRGYSRSELNSLLNAVRIDYKNKRNIRLIKDKDLKYLRESDFIIENLNSQIFKINIHSIKLDRRGTLKVYLFLQDRKTGDQSDGKHFYISGFKTSSRSHHDDDDDDDDDD